MTPKPKKVTPRGQFFTPGTPVQAFPARTTEVERREGRPPIPAAVASGVIGADGTVTITAEPGPYVLFAVTNEVQSVTVDATGGKYTLALGEEETEPIAFNATAAKVAEALEALESVGEDNVTVTGGPGDDGGTKPYVVTFTGDLAATDLGLLVPADEVSEEELEGGGSEVTVEAVLDGSKGPNGEPRTLAFTVDAE